ncbi:MAG: hypothetical protein AAFQ24_13025 [Pseudomonadota bacterium]
MRFQEASQFCLTGKSPCSKTIQSFGNDGGIRFIPHKLFAASFGLDVFVANRRNGLDTISTLQACDAFLTRLSGVLFAFKLGLRCKNCLRKTTFRCFFRTEIQEFNSDTALSQHPAENKVVFSFARKAFVIIEDHNIILAAVPVSIQMRKQLLDLSPLKQRLST